MRGEENMAWDKDTLSAVAQKISGPTLRLFQFSEPTVSIGRLQRLAQVQPVIPAGWPLVQRPTAGGIVFHQNDQCFSLCWRPGTVPIPRAPRDIYAWIHALVLQALKPFNHFHLNACCAPTSRPHDQRQCFADPVAQDVMRGDTKVVGGAMAFQKNAVLYQGSIQTPLTGKDFAANLKTIFERALR
jgi:lipoate-protein ligase A